MRRARPVLIAGALVLVFGGWRWLPAPPWMTPDAGAATSTSTLADLMRAFGEPWLALVVLGLLVAWGQAGRGAVAAGWRVLLGIEREGELLAAHEALAAGARAMVSGGLVIGMLAATCAYLMVGKSFQGGDGPNPAALADLISWVLALPLSALGIGRLVLGPAADAAAVRAGAPERRAFGRRDDLLLLLYVLPAVMAFTIVVVPARTLS